jgi:PadR family transcriptional regulator, regulatory protein PadR
MARSRRGFLFEFDAKVLLEGLRVQREGATEFYGLQVANRLRVEKITVYRSLRRLTALGLVNRRWEDQDLATAQGRPRRRLYSLNRHGIDALLYALRGARALGRQHPVDSNSVTPRRPLPSLARGARPQPRRRRKR